MRTNLTRTLSFSLICGCFLISQLAIANGPPINSETAFTTGLNGAAIRTFVKVKRMGNDKGTATAVIMPVVIPYELVDNKVVLGLGLPLLYKRLDLGDNTSKVPGFGIGDLTLFSKFNMFQKDSHQETFRVAGKVALTFPTGPFDQKDDSGQFPPPLQLGTGAISPALMLIATKLWRRFGLNADLGYQAFTQVGELRRGSILRYDLAVSFRALPWIFGTFPDHQINLMFELNGTYTDNNRDKGEIDSNTGGNLLLASPGIQYQYADIMVEGSVQIPIPGLTQFNGSQMTPSWAVQLGLRWLIL